MPFNNNYSATPAQLDQIIQAVVDRGMIPMVEIHNFTGKSLDGGDGDVNGNTDPLTAATNWFTRSDVLPILQKHSAYLLINFLNEVGNCGFAAECPDETLRNRFKDSYIAAVARMREANLLVPLVIDAPDFGQALDALRLTGPALLAADDANPTCGQSAESAIQCTHLLAWLSARHSKWR